MSQRQQTTGVRTGLLRMGGLTLAIAVGTSACDGVLDVEVPGQVTEEEAWRPGQAELLVNSAIADIECSFSDFIAFEGAGYDDTTTRTVGWWGGAFEYPGSPGTANCSTSETSRGWFTPLQKGRWLAEETYDRLENDWTVEEVPEHEELMGTAAIYAGLAYTQLGEHFCEVAVDEGPLMPWDEALEVADDWYTAALSHIESGGDFSVPTGVSPSAEQMAYLLRARARLARGDLAGALEDAEEIEEGFSSYITRDSGGERTRWNRVYSAHLGLGWVTLLGPIDWWSGAPDPVSGEPWPDVIPHTGYWDLAIDADGRAVSDDGIPVSLLDEPDAVADPRVPVADLETTGGDAGYPMWEQRKYVAPSDDMPLAKWEEAWLIRAQVEGGQEAIDRVNDIRAAHGLPEVTYLDSGDDEGIERMLIEEIRRTHFLEGRYWAAKLRHDLWFPRGQGTDMWGQSYQDGVRMIYPGSEYDQNPNLTPEDEGIYCPPGQDPT